MEVPMVDCSDQRPEQSTQLESWTASLRQLSARIPEIIPVQWPKFREQLRTATKNESDAEQ